MSNESDVFKSIFTLQPVKKAIERKPVEVDDLEEEAKQREYDEWIELGRDE
jgi:hypothetical protein